MLTQVLNNILTVADQLLENSTTELIGSAEIQQSASSRILQALDNLVKKVIFISANQTNSTFALKNLTTELPNIAFSVNRDLFIRDMFFAAIRKEGNISVSITTDNRLAEITSETLTVIKIPMETFSENSETLYSFCLTEPSLFLTEGQLQNINGNKRTIEQVVDSNVSQPLSLTDKLKIYQIPSC